MNSRATLAVVLMSLALTRCGKDEPGAYSTPLTAEQKTKVQAVSYSYFDIRRQFELVIQGFGNGRVLAEFEKSNHPLQKSFGKALFNDKCSFNIRPAAIPKGLKLVENSPEANSDCPVKIRREYSGQESNQSSSFDYEALSADLRSLTDLDKIQAKGTLTKTESISRNLKIEGTVHSQTLGDGRIDLSIVAETLKPDSNKAQAVILIQYHFQGIDAELKLVATATLGKELKVDRTYTLNLEEISEEEFDRFAPMVSEFIAR